MQQKKKDIECVYYTFLYIFFPASKNSIFILCNDKKMFSLNFFCFYFLEFWDGVKFYMPV